MSEPAISIRGISKCYRLGSINRKTFVEEGLYWWHKLRGRDPRQHMTKIGHSATEERKVDAEREGCAEFWALDDVSFDIQPGEVVGVIGRNGAGKSTLLKILTRITEPTVGEVHIRGRIGSLLEVGTGFHPELTGRENIYMNGTFLGMRKREIDAKLDEIIEFSEIEKFIDTPVKRYSSGMYVRLAFSVAAHLEPEILLVDEVLAVGDAAFQKKCLGKMGEVAQAGRTILFVSHNMAAIQNLCHRAVLLKGGRVFTAGDTQSVIHTYLADGQGGAGAVYERAEDPVAPTAYFQRIELQGKDGNPAQMIRMGDSVVLVATVRSIEKSLRCFIGFACFDPTGERVTAMFLDTSTNQDFHVGPGAAVQISCRIPSVNLMPGVYRFSAVLQETGPARPVIERLETAVEFEVVSDDVFKTGRIPRGRAVFYWTPEWEIKEGV